ncbi:MAG: double zinc ribbon domain-containing protein [Promethearchaeota archaeon]
MNNSKLFIITCLVTCITLNYFLPLFNSETITNTDDRDRRSSINELNPKSSDTPFQLLSDFEPSTYYLSPESSYGEKDVVFFTFRANKNGNYSLNITNYPNPITQTSVYEIFSNFDNPNGTDDWYLTYKTVDLDNLVDQRLKIQISHDKGGTWNEKTIKSYSATGNSMLEYISYVMETSVGVNPIKNVIGVMVLYNLTEFRFFRSEDDGSTWTNPINIANITELGYERKYINLDRHPGGDIAFLKNGTIYAIFEANHTYYSNLTSLVFYQSNDNGSSWMGPFNITSLKGFNCTKPELKVDYSSGNYYLMCASEDYGNDYLRGSRFYPGEGLYNNSNRGSDYYDPTPIGNQLWDFYLGEGIYRFNVVRLDSGTVYLDSKTSWTSLVNTQKLSNNDALNSLYGNDGYNAVFDGTRVNLIFTKDYTGNYELYKYINIKNSLFFSDNGYFKENENVKSQWNGRINSTTAMIGDTALVSFVAYNGTAENDRVEKDLFLTIDNVDPSFSTYSQNRYYFNPSSSNASITEIPWDVLSSERGDAILEIFTKNKTLTDWSPITQNSWEDSKPYLFSSLTGDLYLLYTSIESGRTILYLIKSTDKGTTWTEPLKIYETTGAIDYYHGAAWADVVCVYRKNDEGSKDYLYRSFDAGRSFNYPIDLQTTAGFLASYNYIPKMVFTSSGKMMCAFLDISGLYRYHMYLSEDLGVTWSQVGTFYYPDASYQFTPDLIYDTVNGKVHFLLTVANTSVEEAHFHYLSYAPELYSWGTSDYLNHVKATIKFEPDFYHLHRPNLIITRENVTATPIIRAIYIQDFVQGFTPIYKQIISEDYGDSYSGPYDQINLNQSVFTSFIDNTYYANKINDGIDNEIYFRRNSTIIRTQKESVSPLGIAEINYNGLDDFDEYIPEGNYSCKMSIKDYAGNTVSLGGWIYADYNNPIIKDKTLNSTSPTPSFDLNVTVNITDATNFNAKLYYKRDNQGWKNISMTMASKDLYYAIIPKEYKIKQVTYYIRAIDSAGNIETTQEYLYNDETYPSVTDRLLNWTTPIPCLDVNVTFNITDDSIFTAKLFYQRDTQAWENMTMILSTNNIYYAIIEGYNNVQLVNYYVKVNDSAGNEHQTQQWSYSDYNTPDITNLEINWSYAPTPLLDVEVTVDISDESGVTVQIFYSKDDGGFIAISMINIGGNSYRATIPKAYSVKEIRYYIKATDYAGNSKDLDNDGIYYSYNIPEINGKSVEIFDEEERYVSNEDYVIKVSITEDLEYVDKVFFRYSYDKGETWEDLELKQNSPEYSGTLKDIPEDLRILYYQVVVLDIFGNETILIGTQKIDFYPELPSINIAPNMLLIISIVSAIIGFSVAFGYIRLKRTSHERMSREILLKEFQKKVDKSESLRNEDNPKENLIESLLKKPLDSKEVSKKEAKSKGSYPFLVAYLSILILNVITFGAGFLTALAIPEMGILLIGASLLISVLGYMFLMSRDITNNIYSERIVFKNIALEAFQIFFMAVNLISILVIGYMIPWFRYYMLELTYTFGDLEIPRVYLSVIGVFFTSLVLVAITTLIKLKKTVKSIIIQKEKGATDVLLLYVKDQEASKLITRLGVKTIVFLVTVLLTLVLTTEIITIETGIGLVFIILPFIASSILALWINREIESRKIDKQKEDIQLPFMDSIKKCLSCGEENFLSNKFCSNCGEQLVYHDKVGTYIARCSTCNNYIHEDAKFCPNCGVDVEPDLVDKR